MSYQGINQHQRQEQSLYLAPQLRKSLEILQAPAIHLRDTLMQELETNPTLEEMPSDTHLSIEQSEDYGLGASQSSYNAEQDRKREHFFNSLVAETSLQEHLLEQAKLSDCEDKELLELLIGSLDDRGFLTQDLDEIELSQTKDIEAVKAALAYLQSFDPIGVGASSVQESLLIQLKSKGLEEHPASQMLRDHFDLLTRRRIPEMAKHMGVSVSEVEEAIELIKGLDPAPGRRFEHLPSQSIEPDVIVRKKGNGWHIQLTQTYIPQFRVSQTYKDLISEKQLAADEKNYLQEKMKSARFLINAIEQRQKTIERIARTLLEVQLAFFQKGPAYLKPLTMSQVADALDLHETTISRAIGSKYMDTPWGVLPFKYFFSSGYQTQDGTSISSTSIKQFISRLIENEPGNKPYSDQKISDCLLEQENIKIARRTITKYREELGILPTNLRRSFSDKHSA